MCRIQNSINLNVFEPEAESCQIRQRPEFASDWNRRPSNDCASSQEILGCVREERTSCIDFNSFNVKNEFRLGIEFLFRKSKMILIQWHIFVVLYSTEADCRGKCMDLSSLQHQEMPPGSQHQDQDLGFSLLWQVIVWRAVTTLLLSIKHCFNVKCGLSF